MVILGKSRAHFATAALVVIGTLSGCGGGGGGGDSQTTNTTQGLYTGTLAGSATSTQFQMLALDNGDFWAIYGNASGSTFLVNGFVQGATVRSGNSFTSTSIRDFGYTPPVAGTASGTITSSSVSGSVSSSGSTVSFSGSPPATTTYNYNTPAVLSEIQGNWLLKGLDGTSTSVTIAASGSFSGSNAGCSLTGTVAPRPSGKNVFNVNVTVGPAPCLSPGSVYSGIAVTYPISPTGARELIVAGVNGDRSSGNIFFGTR